jgi:hypothetical protein
MANWISGCPLVITHGAASYRLPDCFAAMPSRSFSDLAAVSGEGPVREKWADLWIFDGFLNKETVKEESRLDIDVSAFIY